MKKLVYIFLFLIFSCGNSEEQLYGKYFDFDKNQTTKKYYKSNKKATIPFIYNQVYDPFLELEKTHNNRKFTFEKGKQDSVKLIVIDTVENTINIGLRKTRLKRVKGYPVIIENTSESDTVFFPLFRGGALLIQEEKNEKGKWEEIERLTNSKMGYSYYKVYPKEYIYTKIIKYKRKTKTEFRVKLQLNDSTLIYSNIY